MRTLTGKVAIVTGAAMGIGAAITEELACERRLGGTPCLLVREAP